jgi:hypothetical protein
MRFGPTIIVIAREQTPHNQKSRVDRVVAPNPSLLAAGGLGPSKAKSFPSCRYLNAAPHSGFAQALTMIYVPTFAKACFEVEKPPSQ